MFDLALLCTCDGSLKKSLFSLSEIDLLKSEMYMVTPLTTQAIITLDACFHRETCSNIARNAGIARPADRYHLDPPLQLPRRYP